MQRRNFLKGIAAAPTVGALASAGAAQAAQEPAGNERAYLVALAKKMAQPVLANMAAGKLLQKFPLELSPVWDGRDKRVSYLECFGRLMAGIAPWLSLPDDGSAEGRERERLRQLALQSFANSVDPGSPDYLLWGGPMQTLVDSAYFTNALMRAPKALWEPLDSLTKHRIISEIKSLRRINPAYTNWLLFAAMNEAWLMSIGEQYDPMRLALALRKVEEWYVGDGWIKDGTDFHFDYYNAYVMYPMLLEIVEVVERLGSAIWNGRQGVTVESVLKRAQRFSEHLERLISPAGTYPPIGRSITYRTAAFQPLALLALRKQLPASLPEGQVRAAMDAVHKAIWTEPSNFTADGYLTLGFVGHHPELADIYSNNGSMYIASASLLPLGLPAGDSYWTAPALDWTQKKAFAGRKFPKDGPVKY